MRSNQNKKNHSNEMWKNFLLYFPKRKRTENIEFEQANRTSCVLSLDAINEMNEHFCDALLLQIGPMQFGLLVHKMLFCESWSGSFLHQPSFVETRRKVFFSFFKESGVVPDFSSTVLVNHLRFSLS